MQWRQNFLSRCEIGVRALKQKKLLIIINKKGKKKKEAERVVKNSLA